jgi:hypothetical protein
VPCPAVLASVNRPPSASTRSPRPRSPPPPEARAPPTPSSAMAISAQRSSLRSVTSTTSALAYLAAFVSASAATKYSAASCAAGSRPSRSASSTTGTGDRAARAWRAAGTPRSVSTAGWSPRASSRSSASAVCRSSMHPWSAVAVPGSADLATSCSDSARATRRCWAPSWRSRSIRRRAASAAATMRARDSLSLIRASTLATACATSSANAPRRASASAPNGSVLEPAANAPHMSPSRRIGAATVARIPLARTSRAKFPGRSS